MVSQFPQTLSLSLSLPLFLCVWFLRNRERNRRKIPGERGTAEKMGTRAENGVAGDGGDSARSEAKFPLSSWEVTVASTVLLGFVLGFLGVYLTMPSSDYSFLKLPRTLEDLQLLRYLLLFFFIFLFCMSMCSIDCAELGLGDWWFEILRLERE